MTDLPSGLAPLVLQGHVIDRLRELPDDSIQCVVTSPPFFGLRRYDICGCAVAYRAEDPVGRTDVGGGGAQSSINQRETKPDPSCPWCHGTGKIEGMNGVLWGGSAGCVHEWEETAPRRARTANDSPNSPLQQGNRGASYDASGGKLCAKCNGWLGQFGL